MKKSYLYLSALIAITACNKESTTSKPNSAQTLLWQILDGTHKTPLTPEEMEAIHYKDLPDLTKTAIAAANNEIQQKKIEADPILGPYAKVLRSELSFTTFTRPGTNQEFRLPITSIPETRITTLKNLWEEYLKNPHAENITIESMDQDITITQTKMTTILGRQIKETVAQYKIAKKDIENLPGYSQLNQNQ